MGKMLKHVAGVYGVGVVIGKFSKGCNVVDHVDGRLLRDVDVAEPWGAAATATSMQVAWEVVDRLGRRHFGSRRINRRRINQRRIGR